MLGLSAQGRGLARLDDLAQVHHRDRVAHVGDGGEIVGDEQIGQPQLRLEVAQEVEDLRADGHVERGHGLVQHDQPGRQRERARDGDALTLAAGELVGEQLGGALRQPHQLEQVEDALADLPRRERLVGDEGLGDDGAHAHARVERGERVLEDRLHRFAVVPPARSVQGVELLALEADAAAGGLLEAEDDLGGGRLAAAGLAHEAERLARRDRERDVVHRPDDALGASEKAALHREELAEVPGLDDGGGHRQPAQRPTTSARAPGCAV